MTRSGCWLSRRARTTLEGLDKSKNDTRFGQQITALRAKFDKASAGDYKTNEYPQLLKELTGIKGAAETLTGQVAQHEKPLGDMLAGALRIVPERKADSAPNEVTAEEFRQIDGVLKDVFRDNAANLKIKLSPLTERDLAARAAQRGLEVPEGLAPLETQMKGLRSQFEDVSAGITPLNEQKAAVKKRSDLPKEVQLKEIKDLDDQIKAIRDRMDLLVEREDALAGQWDALVLELIRMETMKDLVGIAQTQVGRDLLVQVAKTSLAENKKRVTIVAFPQFKAPDAGEEQMTNFVNYTPQYFRDRDTANRAPEGALTKADALSPYNPWQESDRTDITLFHELVHTLHYQDKKIIDSGTLVEEGDATDEVDKPYLAEAFGGTERRGVREEEYATVGLGKYAGDKYTENTYRDERRGLDEDVKHRSHYTHKDAKGGRAT